MEKNRATIYLTNSTPWWDNPYEPVSLREIMWYFRADNFIHLERMLDQYTNVLSTNPPSDWWEPNNQKIFEHWESFCREFGFLNTAAGLHRLQENAASKNLLVYLDQIKYARQSLTDEIAQKMFLFVTPQASEYLREPRKGWESVIEKFPSATFDIEEASTCFACRRFTATVFHLMRVMELGLRVVAMTLQDPRLNPKTNPTWERILARCREEQGKPWAERSEEWRTNENFFSGASARLMAVKDAWRNPTMHVETTYTEATSLDVMNHVQSFMRHLATVLHE